MSAFLQLITLIAIILVAAKAAGYISTRFHQPSVFGELLIGVLLGPSLIDLAHLGFVSETHLNEVIHYLGEIGVLLLMFLAGLELHINDLTRNSRVAALSGIFGVILPVGLGFLMGEILGMPFENSIFLGLTLGATSVSISAQVLMELRVLRSRVGLGLLGAAVFDDILVILLLSISLAAFSGGGSFVDIILVFGKILLFLALAASIGLWVLPGITRVTARLPISQGVTTLALVILILFGLASELVGGMAAITGTFLAGLMFARTPEKATIENNLHSLSYAFFVPIFFVSIGLSVDLSQLNLASLWIFLGLTLIAVLGKVLGAGSGALLARLTPRESLQLGIGMVSRGEVGLIIASIAVKEGYVANDLFSVVVGMILITTLITPPLLRISFQRSKKTIPIALSSEIPQKGMESE